MVFARLSAIAALALSAILVSPVDVQAAWLKAESPHFIVYTDRSEKVLREYVLMLEDFDALMRRTNGRPADEAPPRKLDVYLVGSIQQLRRIYPAAHDRLGGFYSSSPADIYAVAIREAGGYRDSTSGDDVVLHEYVHHFMNQYHEAAYPAWLSEGYAEYYATVDFKEKEIVVGNVSASRAHFLSTPGWIGMDLVLSKRVGDLKENERANFYAQSWFLTHYVLTDATRRAKLPIYLKEWRESGDSLAAWKKAYGEDVAALTKSLRNYQNKPLLGRVMAREPYDAPSLVITRLSPGADLALLEIQQTKRPVAVSERPALVERMRSIHKRMPEDRFTRMAAARAETRFGDRAAGDAILRQMLKDDPADVEAMVVLAESLIVSGRAAPDQRRERFAEASKLLGAAMKIAPDDYRIYAFYAQTRQGLPGEPSENTLNVLVKAVELAPQVDALRLPAATALMRAGKGDEVRIILEPIINNPHGGPLTARAKQMIASLDKGAAPVAAVATESGEGAD